MPSQEGIFFHALYAPDSLAYLNQLSVRVDGPLDVPALRAAWRETVRRHDSLRSCFRWDGMDRPVQPVVRELEPAWQEADVPAAEVEDWLAADRALGIDLRKPGLHRMAVLRTGPDRWILSLTVHHLIIDGWSVGVLFQDLFRAYQRPGEAAPPAVGYHTFASWQARQDPAAARKFWRGELAGSAGCTYFGLDRRPRGDWRSGFSDGETVIALPDAVGHAVADWARRERVTPASVCHALFILLLHRFSGQRDIVHGATVSGRPADLPGVSGIVGNFVAMLPLRLTVADDLPVAAFVRQVQDKLTGLNQTAYCSLTEIQRWGGLPVAEPPFSATVTVENYPLDRDSMVLGPGTALGESASYDRTIYPFNLTFFPDEPMRLRFTFDSTRFPPADIDEIARQLIALFAAMTEQDRLVGELLTATRPTTVRRPLVTSAPEPVPFLSVFAATARVSPEATALRRDGEPVRTFAELDAAASEVAAGLRAKGIGPGSRIAVVLDNGPELVEAMLGVLRAGAAFVPIDPRCTQRHIKLLCEQTGAQLVIDTTGADNVAALREIAGQAVAEPVDLDAPAYVMPGESDGGVVSHRALGLSLTRLPQGDRGAPAHGSIMTDPTLHTLLALLANGRPVDLVPVGAGVRGVAELLRRGEEFDFLKATPEQLRDLIALLEGDSGAGAVGSLVVAGGRPPVELLTRWRKLFPDNVIVVEHGPRTMPGGCCAHRIEGAVPDVVPLGRAVPGATLTLLDERGDPAVLGAVGELVVDGVPTGELARLRHDDELEHVGGGTWIDGHRVALDDMRDLLATDPEVVDCVVVPWRAGPTEVAQLVAYVVPDEAAEWPRLVERLAGSLAGRWLSSLPPNVFVQLDTMPAGLDGLPDPDERDFAGPMAPTGPRDGVEFRLAAIWKELLELDSVDVRAPFFDLGGYSMLAVRIVAHVKKEFGRELPLAALLEDGGTLESIAEFLKSDDETGATWTPLVPIRSSGSRRPSYWVHAAGGNVLSYAVIADKLGPEFPIYGLQARGLERGQQPVAGIPAIAAEYVEAIRRRQPTGPYIIAGWSFGGMAAVEIARQLTELGEEVAELIMIDSGTKDAPPATMDPTNPYFLSWLAWFVSNTQIPGLGPEDLAAIEPDRRVDEVVTRATAAGGLPPGFTADDLLRILAVYANCNDSYGSFAPPALPARTTLVRAKENPDQDPTLGWSAHSTGRLRVIDAPGNHVSVMSPESVGVFAPELAAVLAEASDFGAGE